MAQTRSRLGATIVTADTDTTLYTVSAGTEALVTHIVACNIGATQQTFRLAHIDGAIADVANEDYLQYDTVIDGNKSIHFNISRTMAAADTLLVRASSPNIVFSASGIEV